MNDMVANGPPLEVRGLSKRYGPVRALQDVSFRLGHGEVVGLVGDNGAGKSTLVSLISGKTTPDTGEILVDGVPRRFLRPTDARDVGIETVFQTLSLIPTLDIAENVYLNRERISTTAPWRWLHRMDRRRMRREVAEGFERMGLRLPALSTKAAALSGGQRQAVAIARAVLWGSHVVVLDEPTAALGVHQTEIVLSFVERLKTLGVSVVLITHNMEHVMRLCDRVVVLRLGTKIADRQITSVDKLTLVAMMTGAYTEDPQPTGAASP